MGESCVQEGGKSFEDLSREVSTSHNPPPPPPISLLGIEEKGRDLEWKSAELVEGLIS